MAAATQKEVQAQIDKLGAEISDLDEQYNQASIHLQKVQSQIQDSQNQSARAQADFLALQKVASAQAAAIYRAGAPSLLVAFLSSKSLDDFNSAVADMKPNGRGRAQVVDIFRKLTEDDKQAALDSIKNDQPVLAVTLGETAGDLNPT